MSEELKPCPFCGGKAERHTIEDEEPSNAGGDVICCSRCGASSHVEFGRKENLVSVWNTRPELTTLRAENRLLREVLQSIKADCEADYPPSHGAIKYACIDALAQVAK